MKGGMWKLVPMRVTSCATRMSQGSRVTRFTDCLLSELFLRVKKYLIIMYNNDSAAVVIPNTIVVRHVV